MNWLRTPLQEPEPLLNGDLLLYHQAIWNPDLLYRHLLKSLPWQSGQIRLFGKSHTIPRLQCWMASATEEYCYSGQNLPIAPWDDELEWLRGALNQALYTQFNSVLCNLYRSGEDKMGWHSDDEPELGPTPIIASISLGAERDFAVRKKGESKQYGTLPLPHGSLLIMNRGMQKRWQHALPARKTIDSARINLTFREIVR